MIQHSVPKTNVMTTVLGHTVPDAMQQTKHCNSCWGIQTCPRLVRAYVLEGGSKTTKKQLQTSEHVSGSSNPVVVALVVKD